MQKREQQLINVSPDFWRFWVILNAFEKIRFYLTWCHTTVMAHTSFIAQHVFDKEFVLILTRLSFPLVRFIRFRLYLEEYGGILGNTGEYREIQGNTEEYRGIQGNTGELLRYRVPVPYLVSVTWFGIKQSFYSVVAEHVLQKTWFQKCKIVFFHSRFHS